MKYCSSCGSSIPEGQGKCCSMCYGDIDYGTDGYYRQIYEEQERVERLRYEQEERENDENKDIQGAV